MTQPSTDQPDMTWPPPAFLPLPPATVTDNGTRRYEGATYASTPGYRPRLLDVHVPASSAPVPLVVWVHGGGWLDGDRRYPPPTVSADLLFGSILDAGMAVATIDYRHSLEAPFPAQLHDLKAAVRYLRRCADTLGVDGDRVGVWGESAGGHLAALAGLTGSGEAALEGIEGPREGNTTVQAVVDWYGVADITPLLGSVFPPSPPGTPPFPNPCAALLGGTEADWPRLASAASPASYVTPSAPPFLLTHGTADSLVPYAQSVLLAELLQAHGAEATLSPVEGADHIFLGADVKPIVAEAVAFLTRHLRP